MNRCVTYKYILICIVIQLVYCSDNPNNTHDTAGNESDGEDENFEVTEPEEQPTQPLEEPTQQPFTLEPEQTEPLDLSTKPKPVQPQPVQPSQPLRPAQPQSIYLRPRLPVQQPTPTQPIYPRPPLPIRQPIQRYPPHPGYYQPRYRPYQPYAPTAQPYQQLPTQYGPYQQLYHGYQSYGKYNPPYAQITKTWLSKGLKCKTVSFLKSDEKGELVSMTTEDYEESSPETSRSKYVFKSKLEQFYCDDEVIYTRKPEGKYCKCLTYNNKSNYFIITSDDGFALFKKFRGKWEHSSLKIEPDIKLYGTDDEGGDIVIDENHYYTELTPTKSFKKVFLDGITLTKVTVREQTLWTKSDKDESLLWITYTLSGNIVLEFGEFFRVFTKEGERYKILFTRKR